MRVGRLLVHPVKSLDAQPVERSVLLASGAMEHDRAYAILDRDGGVVNAKRHPAVLRLRSHLDLDAGRLALRDGTTGGAAELFHLRDDRARLHDWLGAFLGFPVTLAEDRATGFPDDPAAPGPTVVAAATLRAVAGWFALDLDAVRARFRANIEVEDVPAFWEDGLFGAQGEVAFSIGSRRLRGVNPCQRCAVPARDPRSGQSDPDFVRRFVERRRATLPAWAAGERFDHFYKLATNTRLDEPNGAAPSAIRVGDPVGVHGHRGG